LNIINCSFVNKIMKLNFIIENKINIKYLLMLIFHLIINSKSNGSNTQSINKRRKKDDN
jgi:hypothetical protein